MPEEEVTTFFIVLEGSCVCTERQIHHLEGRTGSDGHRRVVSYRRGKAFGHYPLVIGGRVYDFGARVEEPPGCCLLPSPRPPIFKSYVTTWSARCVTPSASSRAIGRLARGASTRSAGCTFGLRGGDTGLAKTL